MEKLCGFLLNTWLIPEKFFYLTLSKNIKYVPNSVIEGSANFWFKLRIFQIFQV